MREICRVPGSIERLALVLIEYIEVLGVLSMCMTRLGWIAIDQRTAIERSEQPFMRINDQAVCIFDAIK